MIECFKLPWKSRLNDENILLKALKTACTRDRRKRVKKTDKNREQIKRINTPKNQAEESASRTAGALKKLLAGREFNSGEKKKKEKPRFSAWMAKKKSKRQGWKKKSLGGCRLLSAGSRPERDYTYSSSTCMMCTAATASRQVHILGISLSLSLLPRAQLAWIIVGEEWASLSATLSRGNFQSFFFFFLLFFSFRLNYAVMSILAELFDARQSFLLWTSGYLYSYILVIDRYKVLFFPFNNAVERFTIIMIYTNH